MRQVVVTGMGLVLPNCDHPDTFWKHLREGRAQLGLERNPAHPSEMFACARIRDFHPSKYLAEVPERFYAGYHRELQIYLASVYLARHDARLGQAVVAPDRLGLFDGSSRTNFGYWIDKARAEASRPASEVYTKKDLSVGPGMGVGVAAALLGAQGPAYTFAGTCSSGAMAVGHAFREIALGEIDVALATGHDVALVPAIFAMYRDANLLSTEHHDATRAIRPYTGYSNNAFGEGAVTLVLEERQAAEKRGAKILATLSGYKYGNSGHHPTSVDSEGVRPAHVIRTLLKQSRVSPERIGLVVGHGNGVQATDVSEENYMRRVFGSRSAEVPLISTKPIYGHTLGASSALNIAACALMLHHGYIIPTINIDESQQNPGTHHQANRGVERRCEAALAVSYGMGGHNAAVVLERYPSDKEKSR